MKLVDGANSNKTREASYNRGEIRSVDFMPVIIAFDSFQMSKTKLKVALYWIKVSILKQFAENFSYLSFGTVDVWGQLICRIKGFLMTMSVQEYHCCLKEGK